MFIKKILPVFIILIAGSFYFLSKYDSCIGNTNSTFQMAWQGVYQVKVERKFETCGFVAGAYYTFSAHQENSKNWRQIMTVHDDDPIDISAKSIQIVDEKTAVVFMNDKVAVTDDYGKNWNTWNVTELPNWNSINFGYIQDVTVTSDGKGILTLNPLPRENILIPQFETEDFGKNWKRIN